MKAIKLFVSTIPWWAFLLVTISIFVNAVYLDFYLDFSPNNHAYFWISFLLMVGFSIGSLFLLFKKPGDQVVNLFFILLQCIITTVNASYLECYEFLPMMATIGFIISGNFIGPVMIHFLLIFPKPLKNHNILRMAIILFYLYTGLFSCGVSVLYFLEWRNGNLFSPLFNTLNMVGIWTLNIAILLAAFITIIHYRNNKDTLVRNQLMLLFTGIYTSLFLLLFLAIFYQWIDALNQRMPFLFPTVNTLTRMILIACILVAIMRYRIWNIEVLFKKVLLYLGATTIIILSYLILLYLVDKIIQHESNATRFISLAVSVIIFLLIRDRIQKLIDRIFHRESYDAATVVSDFEEKLAGIYRVDDLKVKIPLGLDEIFHFKRFALMLRTERLIYEKAYVMGLIGEEFDKQFDINPVFEKKLRRSTIFSPGELNNVPSLIEAMQSELVVPLIKEDQPFGFFLCGPKRSERIYSMQDIRVLSLIAKRVIALFNTATLYQNDLDRQLMLERERARISQDMHDDIGASLTRIALMSDVVKNRNDIGDGAKQWLGHINDTSRGLMEEMNQIIWALNPKNDTLEGLVAYIRRFAFEYLEPSRISCTFNLPKDLPSMVLTVEVRRNVYLVVREALHNTVKHSEASNVLIEMELNEQGFRLFIRDDGKGFEQGKKEFPGNGLVNMKKRMEDIGGKFELNSKPGEGTEIEIDITLAYPHP